MTRRSAATVAAGDDLGRLDVDVDRARLLAYAAASGDHNPIHWNERFATSVGLPGVIAHGMWTMGAASTLLTRWAGAPDAVVAYSCRFTKPVPVPDPGHVTLAIGGRVVSVDAGDPATGRPPTAAVELDVRLGDTAVLGKARATVLLA